ncbi:hypothetical protein [Bradyrhizobium sp. HKCCYLR20261]|uniref:hypothetical protein n=1 Tax=Bradyrhizobium sp. HKCCYLR20261 TaxID=3420760 RepID=UPI003EBD6032
MPTYLRRAEDRRQAILKDLPDTKFEFESQKFSDIPKERRPPVNNRYQPHGVAAREIQKYNALIEDAAKRNALDPDLVRAVIYTEISRGAYGYAAEAVDRVIRWSLPLPKDLLSKTILPGNLDPSWEKLIPGSDVHKPRDNIELTARLIAAIAKRLDDPSVENIYALYNGLSHDRTYVNKETKSTPYYAKRAFEAKAWEKDDWSAPEVTDDPAEGGQSVPGKRGDRAGQRDTTIADGVPAGWAERFGHWPSAAGNAEMPQAPLLRELARLRGGGVTATRTVLPDGSSSPGELVAGQRSSLAATDGGAAVPDAVRAPIRVLRSRRADQPLPLVTPGSTATMPVQAMPVQSSAADQAPLFDDRFGRWGSTDGASAPLWRHQQLTPMPWSADPIGRPTGAEMQGDPFALPEFGDSGPADEEWPGSWGARLPWNLSR